MARGHKSERKRLKYRTLFKTLTNVLTLVLKKDRKEKLKKRKNGRKKRFQSASQILQNRLETIYSSNADSSPKECENGTDPVKPGGRTNLSSTTKHTERDPDAVTSENIIIISDSADNSEVETTALTGTKQNKGVRKRSKVTKRSRRNKDRIEKQTDANISKGSNGCDNTSNTQDEPENVSDTECAPVFNTNNVRHSPEVKQVIRKTKKHVKKSSEDSTTKMKHSKKMEKLKSRRRKQLKENILHFFEENLEPIESTSANSRVSLPTQTNETYDDIDSVENSIEMEPIYSEFTPTENDEIRVNVQSSANLIEVTRNFRQPMSIENSRNVGNCGTLDNDVSFVDGHKTLVNGQMLVNGKTLVNEVKLAHGEKTLVSGETSVNGKMFMKGNTFINVEKSVNGETMNGEKPVNGEKSFNAGTSINDKKSVNGGTSVNGEKSTNGGTPVNGEESVNAGTSVNDEKSVNGEKSFNGKKSVNTGTSTNGKTLVNGEKLINSETLVNGEKTLVHGKALVTGEKTVVIGEEVLANESLVNGDISVIGETLVNGEKLVTGEMIVNGDIQCPVEKPIHQPTSIGNGEAIADDDIQSLISSSNQFSLLEYPPDLSDISAEESNYEDEPETDFNTERQPNDQTVFFSNEVEIKTEVSSPTKTNTYGAVHSPLDFDSAGNRSSAHSSSKMSKNKRIYSDRIYKFGGRVRSEENQYRNKADETRQRTRAYSQSAVDDIAKMYHRYGQGRQYSQEEEDENRYQRDGPYSQSEEYEIGNEETYQRYRTNNYSQCEDDEFPNRETHYRYRRNEPYSQEYSDEIRNGRTHGRYREDRTHSPNEAKQKRYRPNGSHSANEDREMPNQGTYERYHPDRRNSQSRDDERNRGTHNGYQPDDIYSQRGYPNQRTYYQQGEFYPPSERNEEIHDVYESMLSSKSKDIIDACDVGTISYSVVPVRKAIECDPTYNIDWSPGEASTAESLSPEPTHINGSIQADNTLLMSNNAPIESNDATKESFNATVKSTETTDSPEIRNAPTNSEQSRDYTEESHDITKKNIFYKSMTSNQVFLHLRNKTYFHGALNIRLLAGNASIFGYTLRLNEEVSAHSLTGRSFLYLSPESKENVESDKNFASDESLESVESDENVDVTLNELRACLSDSVLERFFSDFDGSREALVILERDFRNKSIVMIEKYMENYIVPNVNASEEPSQYHQAEMVLHCKFFQNTQTGLEINPQWDDIIMSSNSRQMTIGGKCVGKSTLLRYLINKNLKKFQQILLIDLDVGQPEMFLPQTISATVISKPLLGPGFLMNTSPQKSYHFDATNVLVSPSNFFKCVLKLFAYCRNELSSMPWIVNTIGDCQGLELELTAAIIRALNPTDLIQIQDHLDDYESNSNINQIFTNNLVNNGFFNVLMDEEQTQEECSYILHLIDAVSHIEQDNLFDRSSLQLATILSRLANRLPWNANLININPPVYAHLNDLKIMLNDDLVAARLYPNVINGSFSYLCKTMEDDEEFVECYGIGLVRGVDVVTNKVYLLPSVATIELREVNALVVCSTPFTYLILSSYCQRIRKEITIPYIYRENISLRSQQENEDSLENVSETLSMLEN